jgi:hypothetical protein
MEPNRNTWTADRRLYLDKNGKVVEANDPTRARLLVAAGATIPLDRARELGLVEEAKAKATPTENKLRAGPVENKGAEEQIADLTARLEKSEAERAELDRQLHEQEERIARFQAMTIPPEQRTPEQQALLDNAPMGQSEDEPTVTFDPALAFEQAIENERSAGVQAEEAPKRGKRG